MNYTGFLPDEYSEKDHIFGASTPMEILVPDGDWTPDLPEKELQNVKYETAGCVSFTVLNCVEMIINRKYGMNINWSDRFLASLSETTINGNSPRKVADTLRKKGVVEQSVYPFEVPTYEEFYQDIPKKLIKVASSFVDEWEIGYEEVPPHMIGKALQSSPLLVSVPAWHIKDGVYYRPDGVKDNHATTLIKDNLVFDTYDSVLKDIDLDHSVIKRFYINKRTKPLRTNCFFEWLRGL